MDNNRIQARLWFIILLLVIALLLVFNTKRRGTYEEQASSLLPTVTEATTTTQASQASAVEEVVHTDSYVTGFEDDRFSVSYEIKYKPETVSIQSAGPRIFIREKETKYVHSLMIVSNSGAGFTSTQQLWEEMKLCPECKRINPTIDFGESQDLIMFSNGQKEWAVFSREPGFVIAEYHAASHEVKQVIATLHMVVAKTAAPLETDTVSLFFFDNTQEEKGGCTSTVKIIRTIPKTPRVATAALLSMIEGPTREEKERGIFSLVEPAAWINSLRLENGIARLDLSREAELSKNACEMEGTVTQFRKTLLQFSSIKKAIITVDGKEESIYGN